MLIILPVFSISLYGAQVNPQFEMDFESAGTYPVPIFYETEEGERIEKTIMVTIYYPKTVENPKDLEAIDAHDIELSEDVFSSLSNEELIRLSSAHAWSLVMGDALEITQIIRKKVDNLNGIYEVTFATAKGTAVTIQVLCQSKAVNTVNTQKYFYFSSQRKYFFYWVFMIIILILCIISTIYYMKKMRKNAESIDSLLYEKLE